MCYVWDQCNRVFSGAEISAFFAKIFFSNFSCDIEWGVGAGGMIWGKALVQIGYFQSVYLLTISFLVPM